MVQGEKNSKIYRTALFCHKSFISFTLLMTQNPDSSA